MGRHRIDLISLVFGLVFVTIGGLFVFGRLDAADVGARWIAPSALVVAGLLLAASTLNRRHAATVPPATVPPATVPPATVPPATAARTGEVEMGAGEGPELSDERVTEDPDTEPKEAPEPPGED